MNISLFQSKKGLTTLNFQVVKSTKGNIHLVEALKINSTLNRLQIDQTEILDEGIVQLAEALKINTALVSLSMSRARVTGVRASHLGETLKVNSTLTCLDLYDNLVTE